MTYQFPSTFPGNHIPDVSENARRVPFATYRTVGLLMAISDVILIVAASVIAGFSYHAYFVGSGGDVNEFIAIGANAGLLFILAIQARGGYRTSGLSSSSKRSSEVLLVWTLVLLVITAFLFLLKIGPSYSRGSTLLFGFLALGPLLASRAFVATTLAKALVSGRLSGRRSIVIGDPRETAGMSARQLLQGYGSWEIGRFELPVQVDGETASRESDLAIIDNAIQFARLNDAEQILVALQWTDTARRDALLSKLQVLPLPVFLLPDRFINSVLSSPIRELGSSIAIEFQRAPLSKPELTIKRLLDLLCAAIGILILLPLLALVGIAVKLNSPGPAIFRQRRHGFNRREFSIFKFRTMTVQEDGDDICQARKNDPRVTPIGRFLRATSIDELPQLFNVLRGDMSLVGPRPHACAHDDKYSQTIGNYAFRHHIKPGITGWAQVNGLRGKTPNVGLMKRRVDLDLWYINNWSIVLDLKILIRACLEVTRGRAY